MTCRAALDQKYAARTDMIESGQDDIEDDLRYDVPSTPALDISTTLLNIVGACMYKETVVDSGLFVFRR